MVGVSLILEGRALGFVLLAGLLVDRVLATFLSLGVAFATFAGFGVLISLVFLSE